MKNSVLLLVFFMALTSCKNESKSDKKTDGIENQDEKAATQNDDLVLIKGEFVYFADAAVIQTNSSSIYGVIINGKMHELDKLAQQYKNDPTDYVSVEIRGEIIPKPENEEGWPYRIDIKEIIKVSKSQNEDEVIKLETE